MSRTFHRTLFSAAAALFGLGVTVTACSDLDAPGSGSTAAAARQGDLLPRWEATAGPTDVRALVQTGGAVYAATELDGIHRSTDGGRSWQRLSDLPTGGAEGTGALDLAADAKGRLYAVSEAGAWSSDDRGASWASLGLGDTLLLRTVAVDDAGRVYVGASGGTGGVFRWEGGDRWSLVFAAPNPRDFLVTFLQPRGLDVVLGTYNDDAWLGEGGDAWHYLGVTSQRGFLPPVRHVVGTASGALLATGTSGVWRSTDNGESWTHAEGGLAGARFALDASGRPLLATDRGLVYRSTDDGRTWSPATSSLEQPIAALTVLGDGTVLAAVPGGIYRSPIAARR